MILRCLLASTCLAVTIAVSAPALAAPAVAATAAYVQTGDAYSTPLGDLEIVALSDGTVPQDLHKLLTGTSEKEVDGLLEKSFQANPVEASISAFLIRGADRTILVDTGSGELFGLGYGGKLLDSLAAADVKPQDVIDILITHVHTDYSGRLVAGGKPVFANATVHVGAPDFDFFLDAPNAARTGYSKPYFDEAARTVGVVAKAGKVKTFGDNETILPGIVATLHPGHTPGSAFFTVSSQGQSVVFVGGTSSTSRTCSFRSPRSPSSTTSIRRQPLPCE